MQFLVGIDEAGRGPLAGPVAVGVAVAARDFNWAHADGVRDSKRLTPLARALWYERMSKWQEEGSLRFAVSFASAEKIDREGIVRAIRSAVSRSLSKLKLDPEACDVRLDGSLKAPARFIYQQTIIRGDDLVPVISLASIAAKVERDRLMVKLSARYPAYRFHEHKGYGTQAHRRLISEHGLCDIHRTTFCTQIGTGAFFEDGEALEAGSGA